MRLPSEVIARNGPWAGSSEPQPGRPAVIALSALALLVFIALAWLARAPGILTMQDAARYLLLARDLASGHYRDLWIVGTPAHRLYPPGYPLVLMVARAVAGERFDALVALNILATAGALGLAAFAIARRWSPVLAAASLWVLACHPVLIQRAGELLSEPVFMLLLVAAAVSLCAEAPNRRRLAIAGALALAAAFTRSAGVAVVLALIVLWALERRWRAAAVMTAVSAVLLGGWFLYIASGPDGSTGQTYVADALGRGEREAPGWLSFAAVLWRRVSTNAEVYLTRSIPLALLLPTVRGTLIDNVVFLAVWIAGVGSGLIAAWSRWPAAVAWVLGTFAMLAVWPWSESRFLLPLTPLLVPLLLVGIAGLVARRWPRAATPAALAFAGVLTVSGISRTLPLVRAGIACVRGPEVPDGPCVRPDTRDYLAAAAVVRAVVPAGGVVVSAKPASLYYHSQRRGIALSIIRRPPPPMLLARARAAGAGWVLVGSLPETGRVLGRNLQRACAEAVVVVTLPPRTLLLRIKPAGDTTTGPDACGALEQWRLSNLDPDHESEAP